MRGFQYNVGIDSRCVVDFVVPGMDDWLAIDIADEGDQAFLEFVFGGDADVAQHRTRQLREEALDEVEPRPVRRREREGKAPNRLGGEPSRRLARDMGGMIVENDLDCRVGGVGGVEEPEELNELTAAVAFLDQGMDVTGEQIDASHQGQGAVARVLVIAHYGRAGAGKWRGSRRGAADRPDTLRLVVRGDWDALRPAISGPALAPFC